MERKKKFCSCRLTAHHETGRVRWCVGQEQKWQTKLKRLVFVPIVLLLLVICTICIAKYATRTEVENSANFISLKQFDQSEILEDEERRDLLKDTKTSYAPEVFNNNTEVVPQRSKRDILNSQNYVDYEDESVNETDLYEYFTNYDGKTIEWKSNNLIKIEHIATDPHVNGTAEKTLFWKRNLDYHQIRTLQAKIMKIHMNETADPCQDFYEYACGNWNRHHKIPADKTSYDTFEMLREHLDVILRDILSETTEDEESLIFNLTMIHKHRYFSLDAVTKAKFLYRSCMDEERLAERGEKPLAKLLEELGGWPMITSNWNETKFDLEILMAKLKLYNNDILIAEWIGPDAINSKEYIIQIDQTTLGLPGRSYFLDKTYSKYLNAYKQFIIAVATTLGAKSSHAELEAKNLILFETKIAQIMIPNEDRRNITDLYLRITLKALSNRISNINWRKYFTMVMGWDVELTQEIACFCIDYLHKLSVLLDETPSRTIANYLLWRFVRHRINNLDRRFDIAKQDFYHILFGREQTPPRWQFCVAQVNSNMGMALGSLFVKKYFDENSKKDTLEMTQGLQDAFRIILKENSWLGTPTKEYARMKIDKMNLKIGYPDFLLDTNKLNGQYAEVQIHPAYFFENCLSILRYLTAGERLKLGTEVNKTAWGTAPAVVNAYYSRNKNQITGILQPPFYHQHFPKSLNFGGIGVVIGHEITHGFDDKGRLFDQYGNLQQWWKGDSMYKFHQRAKCIIDQYNSYIVPEVQLNMDGFITQGENIADNGGLKQAFRAYELWLKNNPHVDETLPGLNLTGHQLFFLNFAQVWCGKQRIDTMRSRLKVAVHSPGIFRVIGTLSNSEDFARVYNCPENSSMNPSKKCSLW